jgi:flagellar basal body-associated protein FliL
MVTMVATVFGLMTIAWYSMGADSAYQPDVWDVSTAWILVMLVVSLVAAGAGGYICVLLSQNRRRDWHSDGEMSSQTPRTLKQRGERRFQVTAPQPFHHLTALTAR